MLKYTYQFTKKEQKIIDLFIFLGMPRKYAEGLINKSNMADKNHRFFHPRPIVIHTEEDNGESYSLYDTIFYPPSETKPHHTINQ